jgi:hypothetical protein
VTDPWSVEVPKYYPDAPAVRQSIAQHYDNIRFMGAQWAKCLKYIRNYRPEPAHSRPLVFRDMFPVMQTLCSGHKTGTLTAQQDSYFTAPRPVKELSDLAAAPQKTGKRRRPT